MSKKPTPTTRLAVWKEAASQGGPSRRLIDWSDEAAWAKIARAALDLDSGFDEKWNGPVRKAFKDFRLNPKDPYDWRLLLTLYAAAHASRGRPVKWNSESLCDLLRKISAAREKRPNAKPSEIYRSLVRPKAAYSGKSVDYLKHGHRLALDLERNDILRNTRDLVAAGYLDVLRVSYQEKGWTITAADEKRIKDADTVLDDALELIGAPLGRWAKK
jgi:hypothetical protein